MVEAALSATETALENQRIGGLQIRVAAICAMVSATNSSSPLTFTQRHC